MIRSTRQLLCAMWMTFVKIKVAEIQGSGCKKEQLARRFLYGTQLIWGDFNVLETTLQSCTIARFSHVQPTIPYARQVTNSLPELRYTESGLPRPSFFVLSLRSSLIQHATARLASLASGYILPIMTWKYDVSSLSLLQKLIIV